MIRKLIALNIRASFSGIFSRRQSTKKRGWAPRGGVKALLGVLLVYIAVVFIGMFAVLFSAICDPLFEGGIGWFYFSLMGIIVFSLCVFTSIFAMQAQLFTARDNTLLLPLPIKSSHILLGRIAAMLLSEYMFEIFVAAPALVVWIIHGYASAAGIVFFVLSVILLPLSAIAVACLIGWLVAMASARMRNKNIIPFVFYVLFMAAYFVIYFNASKYMSRLIELGAQISSAVRRAMPPAYYLGRAISDGDAAAMALFALICVGMFAAMWLLLSLNFSRIASANQGAAKKAYREGRLHASGVRATFLKKELAHFWKNPILALNMAFASALMLALAVLTVVKRDIVTGAVSSLAAVIPGVTPGPAVCVALTALASMNCASAAAVSLEGKTLWIARSLPADTRDVLMAKVLMHCVVCGIPAAVAAVVCSAALALDPVWLLLSLAAPLSYTVLVAFAGLALNLLFPKLDWINEIQPAKQGMSVVITVMGTMAIATTLVILYAFVFSPFLGAELYVLACSVLFVCGCAVLRRYVLRGGARRFERL
ncbi:MAG: hypothetical protein LBD92_04000 [Oscillospiraceae bacterium]|nr:hypothetical protein [Oscillospiraceae bacterium]